MDYEAVLYAALKAALPCAVYPVESEQDKLPPYCDYERIDDDVTLCLDGFVAEQPAFEVHFYSFDYKELFELARTCFATVRGQKVDKAFFRFAGQRMEGRSHLVQTWKIF